MEIKLEIDDKERYFSYYFITWKNLLIWLKLYVKDEESILKFGKSDQAK